MRIYFKVIRIILEILAYMPQKGVLTFWTTPRDNLKNKFLIRPDLRINIFTHLCVQKPAVSTS